LLRLEHVHSGYGQVNVLIDVSLEVNGGDIVSLIGANGAGKSTLLKTVSALIRCKEGRVLYQGKDISKLSPHKIVEMGIIQVPEGRQVIGELTVRENLLLGSHVRFAQLGRTGRKRLIDEVCSIFPILRQRINQIAGTLSGGEQQMLAIGRALMGQPKLLLTDEPSLGLAPIIVDDVCRVLLKLNENGLTLFMVEQNALIALEMAKTAYVLEGGKITLHGKGRDLLHDDRVRESYLGV
jgi:branched-chain amino acid transport system ATP-binding protein